MATAVPGAGGRKCIEITDGDAAYLRISVVRLRESVAGGAEVRWIRQSRPANGQAFARGR